MDAERGRVWSYRGGAAGGRRRWIPGLSGVAVAAAREEGGQRAWWSSGPG
jgi:hypothetical protein